MVVVYGFDVELFNRVVEEVFGSFLKGWEWMLLQVKFCDVEIFQGFLMFC